nr:AraC family transcriptional regulator [uncultured Clostridium sp.]
MDLNSLDLTLRSLSSSEEKYKSGYIPDFWDHMPKIRIGGENINCIYFEEKNNRLEKQGVLSGWQSTSLDISIKKNSRFIPVPVHVHDYVEINYVYSGICPQTIKNTDITLKKGQVLIIEPNVPHSIKETGEDDIMISFMVSKKYLRENLLDHFSTDSILSHFFINVMNEKSHENKYLLFQSENSRRTQLFTQELLCECFDPSVNSTDFIKNLFSLIIAELINVYKNQLVQEESESDTPSILSIIRFIEINFKSCSLNSVAAFFHLSPNYLTFLIKKHTGMTYKQLVQSQKLKYAAKFLRNTNMSVTEIANEAGYENISFFYQIFQEHYGCSPKEYRMNKTSGIIN